MTTHWRHSARRALFSMLAALVLLTGAPAAGEAQEVSSAFGGFSKNSNEPIDIESDSLEVLDAQKIAIFRGNVKAVQGSMVLRSRELHVKYTEDGSKKAGASTPATGSGTQITTIDAKGPVIITTADSQTVTSKWALFDVQQQLVTIGGDVVLTQGDNVIKGDRLIIDLKTGRSRVEHERDPTTGKRPRVKGLFMPKKSGPQEKPQQ